MNIIIHRGTHQIGGSCIELSTQNTRIIFDVGQELLSIDDIELVNRQKKISVPGLFNDTEKNVDALFISHYHGDHIGLLGEVCKNIPVFMGEKAARIFNTTALFINSKIFVNPAEYLVNGQEIVVGDFSITPYLIDHSAFDAYAFVIRGEGKCVVYTGDLRAHGNKQNIMKAFLKQLPSDIDALIVEGTIMSRLTEKVKTEAQIGQEAEDFMRIYNRPIFVLQSSTNIDRLVQMYKAARHTKRLFIMDIFTAHIVSQLGSSIPNPRTFKDIRVFYPFYLTRRMFSKSNSSKIMRKFSRYRISAEELSNRKDYCMLIRDSMLFDLDKRIRNIEDAGLIYSMWNGYIKSARMQRLMNFVGSKNMEVIYLHTSGHADVETVKRISRACRPQLIIPVHTEYPERFKEIFNNAIIINDRQLLSI